MQNIAHDYEVHTVQINNNSHMLNRQNENIQQIKKIIVQD